VTAHENARDPLTAAEFSVIMPLPRSAADDRESVFTPLAGSAPLARSVRSMLGPGGVSEQRRIVVASAQQLLNEVRACLAADELSAVAVAVAEQPGTRTQCVAAGLEYFAANSISSAHVLVHDYRRPLTSADVRDRVIARLRSGCEFVIPALPLVDSVKAVDSDGSVTGTVDRSALRMVQYPRGITVDRLSQLVAGCTTDTFDELQEAIRAGLPVTVVEGDRDAFVVEIPRDAQYVEAIISCRRAGRR
jgi:2-C-methyl-D-erythritol 4-phosphate cytidylyltransferase